jgi:hypothetical protein
MVRLKVQFVGNDKSWRSQKMYQKVAVDGITKTATLEQFPLYSAGPSFQVGYIFLIYAGKTCN